MTMKETTSANRREFLVCGTGTAMTAGTALTLTGVHSSAAARKESVRLALIGCGGRGSGLVGMVARKDSAVSVGWLCDINPGRIDAVARVIGRHQSTPPQRTSRYEDVLADKNVDAVIIATPHHWHALIGVAALTAGKDAYIEKPISHVYNEGPQIVAAAKKFGRVVQQGTQMRSSPVTRQAEKLLRAGIIGQVKVARAWTAELRRLVPPVADSSAPAGVDWDRWLGPAPKRPFNIQRFQPTWRYFRDYGNGEIGDDGIHDIDMARWGLGDPVNPVKVTARGSRMMLKGQFGDFPDNMNVTYEYPDGRLLVYENYPFTEYGMHGFDNGNVFYGTEGYMVFSRRGAFTVYLGRKGDKGPTETKESRSNSGLDEHLDDFLQAVRTRTSTRASAEIAHHSCALVHLGEIAFRTRGQLDFDPQSEQFVGCDEANELLTKPYRAPYLFPEV
jgi:predicted dehydrogenase